MLSIQQKINFLQSYNEAIKEKKYENSIIQQIYEPKQEIFQQLRQGTGPGPLWVQPNYKATLIMSLEDSIIWVWFET